MGEKDGRKELRRVMRAVIRKRRAHVWRMTRASQKEWDAIHGPIAHDARVALRDKKLNKMDASGLISEQDARQRSPTESMLELDCLLRDKNAPVVIKNHQGSHLL